MARRIFEPSVSSDSPVDFTCKNMGFFKNLHSSDFGGHFFIFGLYFRIVSKPGIHSLSITDRFQIGNSYRQFVPLQVLVNLYQSMIPVII